MSKLKKDIEIGLGIRRRHKYNVGPPEARTVDGIVFDSAKEAGRWKELRAAEKAGIIHNLERQVRFPLMGHAMKSLVHTLDVEPVIGFYEADFIYVDDRGRSIVEDCKGVRTALYRWKRRHFELQYGLKILET